MEERILKKAAVFTALVSIASCMLLPFFPRIKTVSEAFSESVKEYRTKTKAQQIHMTGLELVAYNNEQAAGEAGGAPSFSSQLRLEMPLGVAESDIKITNNYLNHTVCIRIPYAGEDYIYEYPILGDGSRIESLNYAYEQNIGTVEFVMEQVFEPVVRYDEDYLYLDFRAPKELYDTVVVIDAGHGGSDLGTVKQGAAEKEIALDIALKIKEIADASKESIGIYCTREKDENPDMSQRTALAKGTEADLFLSIHANATASGRMSSISGTQAVYTEAETQGSLDSKAFAQICLEETVKAFESSNKGLAADNGEYGLKDAGVPAAQIEIGFMTNQAELDKLRSKEYQNRAARGIYNAIVRASAGGWPGNMQ